MGDLDGSMCAARRMRRKELLALTSSFETFLFVPNRKSIYIYIYISRGAVTRIFQNKLQQLG